MRTENYLLMVSSSVAVIHASNLRFITTEIVSKTFLAAAIPAYLVHNMHAILTEGDESRASFEQIG